MHPHMLLLALCLHAAAVSAAVFTPPSPLLVNAFAGANESWFRFPEASSGSNYSMPSVTSRPRFGIAISGGGMRAATLGLGYLRGLQQVHVLTNALLLAAAQAMTVPVSPADGCHRWCSIHQQQLRRQLAKCGLFFPAEGKGALPALVLKAVGQ